MNDNIIKLGTVISGDDEQNEIGIPINDWSSHALITGMAGTGKTTLAANILYQFAERNIPFLVIEPNKKEYCTMLEAIPDLQIYTPGNNKISQFTINPFIPPEGITIEQYTPILLKAFNAAFSLVPPLDMFFMKALYNCYTEYGWKETSKAGDKDVQPFGFDEYISCFKKMIRGSLFSKNVKENLESSIHSHLSGFVDSGVGIYGKTNSVSISELLSKPTVLELGAIDNPKSKAFILTLLLSIINIYKRVNKGLDRKLNNIILIEDANYIFNMEHHYSTHNPLEYLNDVVAEAHTHGTGFIFSAQMPSELTNVIIANTRIKVSFKLPGEADKCIIKDSMNLSKNDMDYFTKLHVGQAFVYSDILDSPQLIQIDSIHN